MSISATYIISWPLIIVIMLVQEKAVVSTALDKAKDRAAINFSLAEKLNKLIGRRNQTQLLPCAHCLLLIKVFLLLLLQAWHASTPAIPAGAKQTELIALLHRTGQQYGLPAKPFSVGPTGSISVDDDITETAQSGIDQVCCSQIACGTKGTAAYGLAFWLVREKAASFVCLASMQQCYGNAFCSDFLAVYTESVSCGNS